MSTASRPCPVCRGSRWLCEAHVPLRWRHDDCDAAGVPCVCRGGNLVARSLRMLASGLPSSGREVERRRVEPVNRRAVDRRAAGADAERPTERRAGERRLHDRRDGMA